MNKQKEPANPVATKPPAAVEDKGLQKHPILDAMIKNFS